MTETESLVKRAQEGERAALEALLGQVDRDVFGLALLILGDRAEAQDAAQEVLIKVCRGLGRYQGRSAFRTWLYRVTVNHCRDTLRRRVRRWETDLDAEPSQRRSGAIRPGALQRTLDRERAEAVWAAVQALDDTLREAVVLRYYLDLPCTEIAEVMETPVNTVYWRLFKARKLLEQTLLADEVLADEIGARREEEVA